MAIWNPWHGCIRISPGCLNCYVYRRDSEYGKDSSIVSKTSMFDMPLKKNRSRQYKLSKEDEPIYTCMTSDFFIEEADEWRKEAWDMIRIRSDLIFVIITKRIDRFKISLPTDWKNGYDNVCIYSTCENQNRADYRIPILLKLPIKHRGIIHEPMLEKINIEQYLKTGLIEKVICGGESGEGARLCDYSWILDTLTQCVKYDTPFYFKQTGARFKKGNNIYNIPRNEQHAQADKADINYRC